MEVIVQCPTRELAVQMVIRVANALLDIEDSFMEQNILYLSVKRKSTETEAMCEKVKKMSTEDQRRPVSEPEEDTCSLKDK